MMRSVVFLFFLFIPSTSLAQDMSLFCDKKQVIWYGLDFSMARFMGTFSTAGDKGKLTPQELKGYFDIWNERIIAERKKVDYSSSLGFSQTIENKSVVKEKNDAVDPSKMIIFEYYTLKEQQLDSMINQYVISPGEKGLGLTFIVEYLDKVHAKASVYAVFFNVETKKVLFKQNIQTLPIGVNQSNYWLNAFLKVFTWIDEKGNKQWQSKHCR
jgi:hypothetical protein